MPAIWENHVGRANPLALTRTYGPFGDPGVNGGSVAEYWTVTVMVPAPFAYALANSRSPVELALALKAVRASVVARIVLCVWSSIFAAARAAASVAFCRRVLFSV